MKMTLFSALMESNVLFFLFNPRVKQGKKEIKLRSKHWKG